MFFTDVYHWRTIRQEAKLLTCFLASVADFCMCGGCILEPLNVLKGTSLLHQTWVDLLMCIVKREWTS